MALKTELSAALGKYLADEGTAIDLLSEVEGVTTAEEARLACLAIDRALSRVVPNCDWKSRADLSKLVGLLQDAKTREAIDTFIQHGLPRLRRQIRDGLTGEPDSADVRPLALKMLAMYGQPEDAPLLIQAARSPALQGSYLWSIIFDCLKDDEVLRSLMLNGLRSPLPSGFAAVAYLDFANERSLAGDLGSHPFDSDEGNLLIASWLTSRDVENYSYAVSATAALPFLNSDRRKDLLQLSLTHPDANVRMEAAWAQARVGNRAGLVQLQEYARDPRHSNRAMRYLEDLGADDLMPAESKTEDFQALAKMCEWLAHPNEVGRPPDRIEQVDSQELYWPPTADRRRLWVFRYEYDQDDGGVDQGFGLTGSVTWAMMFGDTTIQEPEDVYCLHCAWELQMNRDPKAPSECSVEEGRRILQKFNPRFGRPNLNAV